MARMPAWAGVVVAAGVWPVALPAGVVFDRTTADAGEVRCGQPLAETFSFRNDGPEEVEIVGLRTGCGCLRPRLEQRRYAPGERGRLTLEIHTLSQPAGTHAWSLHVTARSGGKDAEITLEVRGRVITEVTVQPPVLTLFAGGALSHPLTLTDRRATPLSVTAVESTSPHLAGQVEGTDRDGEGRQVVRVALRLAADCPDGRHEGTLTLRTDDPSYRELKVPVIVVKRPRQNVMASPASLNLAAAPGQCSASRIVLLRPAGAGAVRVEGVQADDPALQCTWADGPNNLATLRVVVQRLAAGVAQPGPRKSAVHVTLAAPARETITVPVMYTLE